uniref:Signal peptide-domain containing protein n=2 Tax=Rubinisphaera brasiliensis TaxID=119 RepID=F0SRQ6_RUBBR|nr:hypothetical protein Plabr_1568 [Rubinisphaera brasiliensis DSM 5305]
MFCLKSSIRIAMRSSLLLLILLAAGCGKTTSQSATEQLLTSNAVDRVIAQIDFSALSRQRVYFDDSYIKSIKGAGFVNSDYIISSMRQQIMAAGCRLEEKKEDADYVIEARVGALGSDQHEINYGVPANNLLNSASALAPAAPQVPAIPEISLAKKEHHVGAAKIGVFAYHRETREPVWQAGVKAERSRSKESWFLGVGPYQSGTIYEETMFAGGRMKRPLRKLIDGRGKQDPLQKGPPVNYESTHMFPLAYQLKADELKAKHEQDQVEWANHEETQKELKTLLQQIETEQAKEPGKAKIKPADKPLKPTDRDKK